MKHYNTEIVADTFTMLGKKENSTSDAPSAAEGIANSSTPGSDGLPF